VTGGVARLAEAVEHMSNARRGPVDKAHDPHLGVRNDGGIPHRLDAPRVRGRRDVLEHRPAQQVDRNKTRLKIGSREHDQTASPERRCGRRQRARRKRDADACEQEAAPIHTATTARPRQQVPSGLPIGPTRVLACGRFASNASC
jgi:hypothetical protein